MGAAGGPAILGSADAVIAKAAGTATRVAEIAREEGIEALVKEAKSRVPLWVAIAGAVVTAVLGVAGIILTIILR
jgi:hypothetical protein